MADTLDLGSSPKGCRFDSCYPHHGWGGNKFIYADTICKTNLTAIHSFPRPNLPSSKDPQGVIKILLGDYRQVFLLIKHTLVLTILLHESKLQGSSGSLKNVKKTKRFDKQEISNIKYDEGNFFKAKKIIITLKNGKALKYALLTNVDVDGADLINNWFLKK